MMESKSKSSNFTGSLPYSSNDLMKSSTTHIKIEYEGEIRKIQRLASFELLLRQIKEKFDPLQNVVDDAQIKIFYYDSDSMKMSISTDEDVEEALS